MEFSKKDLRKIKEIVISQFNSSKSATESKRNLMRTRSRLYNNETTKDEHVRVNLIRWLVNSLLALYYTNKLTVQRSSRDLYNFIEASNFQSVYEYNHDNLDMEVDDYTNQKNRFLYWVWIRKVTWWDDREGFKNPTFSVVNPLSWYPDPNWHTHPKNFEYMWFEEVMTVEDIKAHDEWMNTWKVRSWLTPDMEITKQELASSRELSPLEKDLWNHSTVVYTHYLKYKNKPVQVIMRWRTELLDVRVVEPLVTDDTVHARFPVALNYFEPLEWDPMGVSIYDIAEDKQKLKTLMFNLIRIQAIKQALWGRIFLDRSIYTKSKRLLELWTVWPQIIPVDWRWENISNMVFNQPEQWLQTDVYNFTNMLQQQTEDDTWLSALTRWVSDPNADTATEVKTAQMNANINLILWNRINAWGEKQFARLWYLFYKHYFSEKDQKYVELNRWIWQAWDIFSRKNIITWKDPRVKVLNKWEAEAQNKSDLQTFIQTFGILMQDPETPPVARRYLKRKLMRLQWSTQREIEEEVPYTPEELQAQDDIQLLNNNIPVQIEDPNEDHYTFLVLYQSALMTPATKSAIVMRRMAYIQSWQNQQQMQWAWNWMLNWLTNQITAQNNQVQAEPVLKP